MREAENVGRKCPHQGPDRVTYGNGQCRTCARARNRVYARRRRALAPDYLFDEIKIERAVGGSPPRWLHPAERFEIVRLCTEKGLSARETAWRALCTSRQVIRLRGSVRDGQSAQDVAKRLRVKGRKRESEQV